MGGRPGFALLASLGVACTGPSKGRVASGGLHPGACQSIEYAGAGEVPLRRTVYGWSKGRLAWQQEALPASAAGEQTQWSGPREAYTHSAGGSVRVSSGADGGAGVRHVLRGPPPLEHDWTLQGPTEETVRAMYTTDGAGRPTSVHIGHLGRQVALSYGLGRKGVVESVSVDCGTVVRRVWWVRDDDGRVLETHIDMGSGLTDTKRVVAYEGDRLVSERVLRRGPGERAADERMVLECTPWLGSGRGVHEQVASAEVQTFTELERTLVVHDSEARSVTHRSEHVRALGPTVVHHLDPLGNRIRTERDDDSDGVIDGVVEYAYGCWR